MQGNIMENWQNNISSTVVINSVEISRGTTLQKPRNEKQFQHLLLKPLWHSFPAAHLSSELDTLSTLSLS